MNPELPNLDVLQNPVEHKSGINAFLLEQIRLPEEKWSPEFCKLVDERADDMKRFLARNQRIINGEELEEEESPEVAREQTFHRYLEELGLSEEELRGKRIMDLGFGDGGFVKHLIAKRITLEAYGVDIDPSNNAIEKEFSGHLFKQSSEEGLPVRDLDYIVAIRSVSHNWEDTDGYVMNIENVLEKSLSVLRKGGEMRIYPIEEAAKRNFNQEDTKEQQDKLDVLLPVLSKKYGLKYEFEPRNIFVDPDSRDVTLQSVLILRKQF